MNFKSEVNSYEDICKILHIDPDLEPDVSAYGDKDKAAAVSMFRLWNANKAAWSGEVIDFNNDNQEKYEVRFYMPDESDSGLSPEYFICDKVYNSSVVGARLLWPSSAIGEHLTKVMQHDFMNVMRIH